LPDEASSVGRRRRGWVEVLGHYSNLGDQGERVRCILEMVPNGSTPVKIRTPRRVCRRLDSSQINQLVAGYADGIPLAEIATTFGVDQWTVQKYARRNGFPRRSPRLGSNQAKEAADLYVAGSSLASVAKHFGVATDTVAKALTGAGINLRPRRGWKY
jgi:DNA invertase Pin-like site-specific DNA recombinase